MEVFDWFEKSVPAVCVPKFKWSGLSIARAEDLLAYFEILESTFFGVTLALYG